ncbi:MAG TPA: hypothetical protein VHD38_00920 [Candidatus Paceibacterota bacterium]|jgi:hypothetical protein|nr:hypothetical protein [Candidatus Paceibacterota bacterium]
MRRIFFLQAALLALIDVLHLYFGIHIGFYYTVPWWDVLVHFLGGVWVALIWSWVLLWHGYRVSVWQCALSGLVVGIGWEIFEKVVGLGGSPFMPYWVDTAKDLLDDTLGGIAAWLIVQRI